MTKLDKALEHARRGDVPKAIEQLSEMIGEPDMRLAVLYQRAWLLRGLGRYEEALEDYRAILALAPEDSKAESLLADCLNATGEAREALKLAQRLISQDPMNAEAAEVLRKCQRALGAEATLLSGCNTREIQYQRKSSHSINGIVDQLEADISIFPASISPIIARTIYYLVRSLRPKIMAETGSFIGYSTLCIAQALNDNQSGILHAFDLFTELAGFKSPVIGPCSDRLEICRRHIAAAQLDERVVIHAGDSSSNIRKFFQQDGLEMQMAFIDGDHSSEGCLKDWLAVDEYLVEGGLVLFHDTIPEICNHLGPRYVLEELQKRAPSRYHVINLPTFDGPGLGMVQKRTPGRSPRWKPSLYHALLEKVFQHGLGIE
ncbi:class I SAM-dependent methyltransferase [Candidatus Sumerlaeota bacterium]|nr:class I SAM-dependent methyltransferase [Candidatus Sumerlaeota bacterium]